MCRKREMLPSCPHTKNPQDVDNPVDNLGKICLSIYTRHSSIQCICLKLGRMDSYLYLYSQIVLVLLLPPALYDIRQA